MGKTSEFFKQLTFQRKEIESNLEGISSIEDLNISLLDGYPQLISFCNSDEIYCIVNKAYEKFFNIKKQEIIGKSLLEVLGKKTYKSAQIHVNKALSGKKVQYREFFVYPNGKRAIFDGLLVPLKDFHGSIAGYFAVLSDITEFVWDKARLFPGEKNYEAILQHAADAIWMADLDLNLTFVNGYTEYLFGYSPEERYDQHLSMIFPEETIRPIHQILEEKLHYVFTHKKKLKAPVEIELEAIRKDGSKVWVEVKADFIYDNNIPIGIIGVTRDIDKRKRAELDRSKSENLFKTIWEIGVDGMATSDKDGRITNANKKFCEIYGYSREELIGCDFSIIFPEAYRKEAMQQYKKVFSEGDKGSPYKADIVRKDGTCRKVISHIEFIKKNREKDLMLSVVRDVTEEEKQVKEKDEAIQKYELLANYSSDAIVIIEDGNVSYLSPSFSRLLGYSYAELNAMDLFQNVHSEDRERVAREFHVGMEKGFQHKRDFEYRQRHKKGHYIWVKSVLVDRLDRDGKDILIINTKSIQEEQEVRHELERKEALYSTLFKHMSSGVAIYNAVDKGQDFAFIDFNAAAEKITCISRKMVIGEKLSKHFPNMLSTKLYKEMQEVFRTGKPRRVPPFYYEDKDRKGWRENFIFKLPSGELVTIFDDVSERIINEQQIREQEFILKEAQRIAKVGSYNFDLHKGVWKGSETLYEIFGIDENYERTMEGWTDLIHPDEKEELLKHRAENILSRQKHFDLTYSIINQKTKDIRNLHDIGEMFFDENNKPVRLIGTIQDVSEQTKYQKVLEDSRARFLEIFEGVGEGILYLSNDGKILEVNKSLLSIVNKELKQVKGLRFRQIIMQMVAEGKLAKDVLTDVETGLKGSVLKNLEVRFQDKILQVSSASTYDRTGIVAVFRDITNEKRNEQDLLLHKEHLERLLQIAQQKTGSFQRLLYNALEEAVKLTSAKNGYMFLYLAERNKFTHFSTFTGGKLKFLKKRKEFELQDFQQAGFVSEAHMPLIINNRIEDKKLLNILTNEESLKALLSFPVVVDEEVKALLVLTNKEDDFTNDDIIQVNLLMDTIWKIIEKQEFQFQLLTSKVKAEESERFSLSLAKISRKLIEPDLSIPEIASLIYETSLDLTSSSYGFVSSIDPETGENTGYHLGEQEIDQQFTLQPGENGYKGMWGAALNTGKSFYTNNPKSHPAFREEYEGKLALENFLAVPALIDKKVMGEIILANKEGGYSRKDISIVEELGNIYSLALHRKYTEEALIKAKEKAIESDQLKSSFLANMSHEIRTPMNGIVGFTEFLAKNNLTPEKRAYYAKIIVQSSHQLLSIVNDILDISKIETGQFVLTPEVFNVNDLIMITFTLFEQRAKEQAISLFPKKALSDSLAMLEADQTKLKQIFANLLSNAFKFTSQGQISFGYTLKEKEKLTFFVQDTGIGIQEEFHSRIFQRFTQAENTLSRSYGGTGLGLAITKSLVELMGGQIWFETEVNKGTTFYFTLPYSQKLQNNNLISKSETTNNMENNSNFTVLVAEDEEINYIFIEELLSELNLNFLHARNGQEAVEMFSSREDIGLVLMDIKMPVMNGYDATRAIKSLNPSTPVYAQTAYAMSEDKEKARAAGCDGHLAKPLNQKELIDIILAVKNNFIEPSS